MVGSPLTRDWALFSCDSEQGHSAPPSWTAGWALTCSFWATEGPWRTASTRLDRNALVQPVCPFHGREVFWDPPTLRNVPSL